MSSTAVVTGRHRAGAADTARPAGTTAPAPVAPPVRRPMGRRLLGLVANAVLLFCALVFVFMAVGPHVLGYRTATMLTGSMEPGIMPGDVVVTMPEPAADLAVGDVISYHIPVEDHRVESHRVSKVIHHEDGTISFQTKGDNNDGVDPWTATIQGDTVWQVKAVIPELGTAIRAMRSPAVQHGVFWISFAGLMLLGLSLIWGKEKDATDDAADDSIADAEASARSRRDAA